MITPTFTFPAAFHNPLPAQYRQMLRDIGLPDLKQIFNIGDTFLSFPQFTERSPAGFYEPVPLENRLNLV